MPTPSTSRSRASLAVGTAVALFAASLSIGINPAAAEGDVPPVAPATVEYATVTGHEPQSSIANKPSYWCADGWKIEGKDLGTVRTYLLPEGTYSRVIVKAGSGPTANTIFAAPPEAGQTVWADFDPSEVGTNDGPNDGDKTISHIIVCPGPLPEKTDLTVTKVWAGDAPEEFLTSLTSAAAGGLSVTVDGEPILEPAPEWGSPIEDLPVGVKAEVSEGAVPQLPGLKGYRCEVTGSPAYSVNGGAFEDSASFTLRPTSNTVQVRNTVTCIETTTLQVVKLWTGVPAGNTDPVPGPLSITVNGASTGQTWNDVKDGLPVKAEAVVSETKPTLPTFNGVTCTLSDPSYIVNGGAQSATAVFNLQAGANKVTVVNALTCTAIVIPPVDTPPAVIPPVVTPPAVTPPVVTPPVVEEVVDEADVAAEEDVVEEDEETAVAGSEDELAATGGSTSAALLGALLVLSGAALIASRRRFGMTD